jgi:hypothetical protein
MVSDFADVQADFAVSSSTWTVARCNPPKSHSLARTSYLECGARGRKGKGERERKGKGESGALGRRTPKAAASPMGPIWSAAPAGAALAFVSPRDDQRPASRSPAPRNSSLRYSVQNPPPRAIVYRVSCDAAMGVKAARAASARSRAAAGVSAIAVRWPILRPGLGANFP